MAQLVELLTVDFGSGHDLTVPEIEAHIGLCNSLKPAWDSLSLCPSLTLTLSQINIKKIELRQNKHITE